MENAHLKFSAIQCCSANAKIFMVVTQPGSNNSNFLIFQNKKVKKRLFCRTQVNLGSKLWIVL